VQTPRRKGFFRRAGDLLLEVSEVRGLRTSWLIVGIAIGSNLEKAVKVDVWIGTASFFWKETAADEDECRLPSVTGNRH
jgi:hypothetical protein